MRTRRAKITRSFTAEATAARWSLEAGTDSEELTSGPGALGADVLHQCAELQRCLSRGKPMFPLPILALVTQGTKKRDAAQRATQTRHLWRCARSAGGVSDVPLIFIFHF